VLKLSILAFFANGGFTAPNFAFFDRICRQFSDSPKFTRNLS